MRRRVVSFGGIVKRDDARDEPRGPHARYGRVSIGRWRVRTESGGVFVVVVVGPRATVYADLLTQPGRD